MWRHGFFFLGIAVLVLGYIVVSNGMSKPFVDALIHRQYRIYLVFTNRLARLPGPEFSKWTNLRLKTAMLSNDRIRHMHSLHERYGMEHMTTWH